MIHNFLFLKGGKVNEQTSTLFLYSWEHAGGQDLI